jgi:hypothetical protein
VTTAIGDERLALKIFEHEWTGTGEAVTLGNDEDEALTVDGSDGDVFAAGRQTQKACVESALLQHGDLIGGADVEQIQCDAGMVAAKGEDDQWDEL